MKFGASAERDDLSIVVAGEAGQGIQTVEGTLTWILKLSGYHIFATKEYMSRIRGGANSTLIRVSSRRVAAPTDRIDILVPLDRSAIGHLRERISPETVILGDMESLKGETTGLNVLDVPTGKLAEEVGGKIFANIVVVGVVCGLLDVPEEIMVAYVRRSFSTKQADVIDKNILAGTTGHRVGSELRQSGRLRIDIRKDASAAAEFVLNGAEALSLGAIAGGCNFISSYPMSPSTPVLTFLAQNAERFGVIVEQAEDEISAVNMTLGAWYAGARGMATTSGGGFALMGEGVSLAGMLETPLVVHVAQRPGPATGLPTRTEQGDLNFVLHAGHGDFPRVIFSPGTLQEAFELTRKAFDMADHYQIPVFILTDEYLIDSYSNLPEQKLADMETRSFITETAADYRRYEITADGISRRGVPGFGRGLVCVDSDEHDEEGHITENLAVRCAMVEKRLRKMEGVLADAVPPTLIGSPQCRVLVVAWGSTFHIIREALERIGRDDLALLHFSQVHPLHPATADYLSGAGRIVVIEGNATGQFADILKLRTGFAASRRILKYSGLQFTVEEIETSLREILGEEI